MADKTFAKIQYSYDKKGANYEIEMEIDLSRFNSQFYEAQYKLDNMVMTSMVPFMPMQTGTFINVTRAMSAALAGSGKVVAAAPPMGRFLYEGKVMVGERTRSAWAERGEKKVVTGKALDYSKAAHPRAQSHWFEAAKAQYGEQWIRAAKQTAGGGKRG